MGRGDAPGPGELRAAAAVARRYYLKGESKVDIAAELGLSRFKVARLLDLAKESGMVRIEVVEAVEEQMLQLAARVKNRWGLQVAITVLAITLVVLVAGSLVVLSSRWHTARAVRVEP